MNNHEQFLEFCSNKRLTSDKKKELREKRDIIREKIRVSFADNGRKKPNFAGQGSYAMNTTIKPLDGEYDIDDGIYLNNIDTSKDINEWEKTETVHSWVYKAVENHTNITEDKARCVRVIYAKNYHVDLPIYVIKDDICYIAEKGDKQWHKSDPKAINDWFKNRDIEDKKKLERLSVYLKAWKDFRKFNNQSLKLVGGLQLTVLAEKYFVISDNDEEMFFKTIEKINNALNIFSSHPPLNNPVDTSSNLFSVYSDGRIEQFKKEFDSMYSKAKDAYEETDNLKSNNLWKKVFGTEFPSIISSKSNATNNSTYANFQNIRLSKNDPNYSAVEQYIEDLFPMRISYQLKIDCEVTQKGYRPQLLNSINFLQTDKELKFFVKNTNVPEPYQIKWKVKNQGEVAKQKNQLRGEITNDGGYKEKTEHTKYKGSHYVECYIIKNGYCVARDIIFVPIEIHR